MNEILFELLVALVAIAVTIFVRYVAPYFKYQIEDSKYAGLLEIIDVAVRAAEQTLQRSGAGAEKKKRVVAFVTTWLDGRGIKISEDQLDKLIEAAVYTMKHEVNHG